MNWPPIEADGPVVAEARRILRDPNKPGRYWSLNEWRHFILGAIKELGLQDQPTSEARMALLGPALNQYGAAPQRGTTGRWTGRIYFPPPPPDRASVMIAQERIEQTPLHKRKELFDTDALVHDTYWWDFQRFVDIVQDPWGSSSWVWIIRHDPGPPPKTGEEPPPQPEPTNPPKPPDGLEEVLRVVTALSHRVSMQEERVAKLEQSHHPDSLDEAVAHALDRILPTLQATGRTQSSGGFLAHTHHCDLTIERKP